MQQLINDNNHSSDGEQHDRLAGAGQDDAHYFQGERPTGTAQEFATELRNKKIAIKLHHKHDGNDNINLLRYHETTRPTLINYKKQSHSIHDGSQCNSINKRHQGRSTLSSFILHISTISLVVLLVASQQTITGGGQSGHQTGYYNEKETDYHGDSEVRQTVAAAGVPESPDLHGINQFDHQTHQRQSVHNEHSTVAQSAPPLCNDCLAIPLIAIMGNGKQVNGFIIQSTQKQQHQQQNNLHQQQQAHEHRSQLQTRQHHVNQQGSAHGYSAAYERPYVHLPVEQTTATPKLEPKSDIKCPMNGSLTVCDQIDSYPAEVILHKLEVAKKRLGHATFNIDSLFTDERDNSGEPFDDQATSIPRKQVHPPRRIATKSTPDPHIHYSNYQAKPDPARFDYHNHHGFQERQSVRRLNTNDPGEQKSPFSPSGDKQATLVYQQTNNRRPGGHGGPPMTERDYGGSHVISVRKAEGVEPKKDRNPLHGHDLKYNSGSANFRAGDPADVSIIVQERHSDLSQRGTGHKGPDRQLHDAGNDDEFLKIVEGRAVVLPSHPNARLVSSGENSKLISADNVHDGERYVDDNLAGQRMQSSERRYRTQVNLIPSGDPLVVAAAAASAVKQAPTSLTSNNSRRSIGGHGGRFGGPIYQSSSSVTGVADDVVGNDTNGNQDSVVSKGQGSSDGISRVGLSSSTSTGRNSTRRRKSTSSATTSPVGRQRGSSNSSELLADSVALPQLQSTLSTSKPLPVTSTSTFNKRLDRLEEFDGAGKPQNSSVSLVNVRHRHVRRQVANVRVDSSGGTSTNEGTDPESVGGGGGGGDGGGEDGLSSSGPTEPAENQVQPEPVCRAKSIYISPKAAVSTLNDHHYSAWRELDKS